MRSLQQLVKNGEEDFRAGMCKVFLAASRIIIM